jgi:hypothetical protein
MLRSQSEQLATKRRVSNISEEAKTQSATKSIVYKLGKTEVRITATVARQFCRAVLQIGKVRSPVCSSKLPLLSFQFSLPSPRYLSIVFMA